MGVLNYSFVATVEVSPLNVTFTSLNVAINNSGTGFAITITANDKATFECQVDDENFVPCKELFVMLVK